MARGSYIEIYSLANDRKHTQGGYMRKNLNRPWLTASNIERSTSELKEISKSWDEQTWSDYLNWFELTQQDKLVSETQYSIERESIVENIFEDETCPKSQNLCDQLLSVLPHHQQRILRAIFFEGKTERDIAFDFNKSAGCIAQNKNTAIATLKQVHRGKMLSTRPIIRGEDVYNSEKIKSIWNQTLSSMIKENKAYGHLNANQELLNHHNAELREIFQELSERSRQIIYLKFWCGLSHSEIARKGSVGVNTVEQIIDATVFKIKSQLIQNMSANFAST